MEDFLGKGEFGARKRSPQQPPHFVAALTTPPSGRLRSYRAASVSIASLATLALRSSSGYSHSVAHRGREPRVSLLAAACPLLYRWGGGSGFGGTGISPPDGAGLIPVGYAATPDPAVTVHNRQRLKQVSEITRAGKLCAVFDFGWDVWLQANRAGEPAPLLAPPSLILRRLGGMDLQTKQGEHWIVGWTLRRIFCSRKKPASTLT